MALRKRIATLRDTMVKLVSLKSSVISEEMSPDLNDVLNILTAIYLEIDSNSELISSLLDIHLNVTATV